MISRRSRKAVTLVELLVVMSIIAMLAAVLGLAVPAIGDKVNESRARADMSKLMAVLEFYRKDCGEYPDAINHNPGRIESVILEVEPQGSYPRTDNPSKMRSLYATHIDESSNQLTQYSELVWTLGSTYNGWSNPRLWEFLEREKVNFKKDINGVISGGQLIDPWGRRIFYMSCVAYRRKASGTTAGGGSEASAAFVNPGTYQIYSAGDNRSTPLDKTNRAGTDEDDLRNW
jgi:prepilin-type N-terminal cleavage/methylation domain-containing protein